MVARTSSGGTGVTISFIRTRSSSDKVALSAPSGRPNGKQYLCGFFFEEDRKMMTMRSEFFFG